MPTGDLKLGSDPEFVLVTRNGRRIVAQTVFREGLRGKAIVGGNVGCNGCSHTGEMRPSPANNPDDYLTHIEQCIRFIARRTRPIDTVAKVKAGGLVDETSIGGHVHFSHFRNDEEFYKLLTMYLGGIGHCMMYEIHKARRVWARNGGYHYGELTDIRPAEAHAGFEFRGLCSWLYSRELAQSIFALSWALLNIYDAHRTDGKSQPFQELFSYATARNMLSSIQRSGGFPATKQSNVAKDLAEKLTEVSYQLEHLRFIIPDIYNCVRMIDNEPNSDVDIRTEWLGQRYTQDLTATIENIVFSNDDHLDAISQKLSEIVTQNRLQERATGLYVFGVSSQREQGIYLNPIVITKLNQVAGRTITQLGTERPFIRDIKPIAENMRVNCPNGIIHAIGFHATDRSNTELHEKIAKLILTLYNDIINRG